MSMTYAAQVRSVSKSVSPQQNGDDFYDINSLRIICKYFVGSVVTVKTNDEIMEGVLHTISHNKICMTLVTTAKLKFPENITETSSNKLINLNDVLFISTKGTDTQEVTVKGKYIKIEKLNDKIKNNNLISPNKPVTKVMTNGILHKKPISEIQISETNKENTAGSEIQNWIKPAELSETNSVPDSVMETEKPKKSFAFNPNAPEFKPRSNVSFSDNINGHILFSPHAQQFPPVFTPNSAPAIFVPNIFFYAQPNQPLNNMENRSFEKTNVEANSEVPSARIIKPDEQFIRKPMPELHIANPALPFPQMLPIFPPSLPIFVPNHSFKFNNVVPFNNVEMDSSVDDSESIDNLENNELSNPSNWPPLPMPGNQSSTAKADVKSLQ